jgi:hypothetical protein
MAVPPGSEPEITFVSGVANATVAPISFGSWVTADALNPATYNPTVSSAFHAVARRPDCARSYRRPERHR